MEQIARNVIDCDTGVRRDKRFLIFDCDAVPQRHEYEHDEGGDESPDPIVSNEGRTILLCSSRLTL